MVYKNVIYKFDVCVMMHVLMGYVDESCRIHDTVTCTCTCGKK